MITESSYRSDGMMKQQSSCDNEWEVEKKVYTKRLGQDIATKDTLLSATNPHLPQQCIILQVHQGIMLLILVRALMF